MAVVGWELRGRGKGRGSSGMGVEREGLGAWQ